MCVNIARRSEFNVLAKMNSMFIHCMHSFDVPASPLSSSYLIISHHWWAFINNFVWDRSSVSYIIYLSYKWGTRFRQGLWFWINDKTKTKAKTTMSSNNRKGANLFSIINLSISFRTKIQNSCRVSLFSMRYRLRKTNSAVCSWATT